MVDLFEGFTWQLIVAIVGIFLLRLWLKGKQFNSSEKAKNKVAVVTGANCGIGKQVVRLLNERGAKVYLGCRSEEKGRKALAELAKNGCAIDRLILLKVDMCSFQSVRRFAQEIASKENHVDILVNNAGIMFYPKFQLTEDGHEITWQTNYLSHFLLVQLLLPLLKQSTGESRIVNVSAASHFAVNNLPLDSVDRRDSWDSREAYSRSKLAMIMQTAHLSSILRRDGCSITINSSNPGICYTRLGRYTPFMRNKILNSIVGPFAWFFLKTPKDGAQCPLFCCLSKQMEGLSGKYVSECKITTPSEMAMDSKICDSLYSYSMQVCGLNNRD